MNITEIVPMPDYHDYQPIGDKVLLVLLREDAEKLEDVGGILVDRAVVLRKNPMRETEVTAVGPECKQVRKGDVVLWNRLNGQPFPMGDHDLYFLPENHLVCVTKQAKPFKPFSLQPPDAAGAPDEGSS